MFDIEKAFNNRWRYKKETLLLDSLNYAGIDERVKALCYDFFEAGVMLAQRFMKSPSVSTMQCEYPDTDDEAFCVEFETFWNAYEKKVGRPKCEKLWAKLSLADKKACIEYIPLYKQAQPDKQYRKNPETFLRNKSWNDELIYHSNATDSKHTIEQQRMEKLADILAG